MRTIRDEWRSIEMNCSLARLVNARDHIEDGRLAGAIGTNEAGDRSSRDDHIDAINCYQTAEALGEIADDEDVLGKGGVRDSRAHATCPPRTSGISSSWRRTSN